LKSIKDSNLVKNPGSFDLIAKQMKLHQGIRPGKYQIEKGMSLFDLARLLRNGRQSPVNLVITKLRTKEQFASLAGKKLECDSSSVMKYMNNPDTLKKYGLDTNSVMTTIFPNTYIYFWNTSPTDLFKKFYTEYNKVWTEERKELAAQRGLNPSTAYILASIIEEETNIKEDKGNMASVYLNRLSKNIKLGADPTVKFALRDFGLQRIYEKHLNTESPYNTYKYRGLPPGPICTPSLETLDEVLHSPKTNYLFFVAKSDFSKRHVFTETYADHRKYAKEYQKALDQWMQKNKSPKG
jgi:UPF0755 protein